MYYLYTCPLVFYSDIFFSWESSGGFRELTGCGGGGGGRDSACAICTGNRMIWNAIWDKSARVNFSKTNKIARACRASAICMSARNPAIYALVIGFPEGGGGGRGADVGTLLIVHFKVLVFPHRSGIFF